MAGIQLKQIARQKIEASSILEVVISMVVIVLIFSIAMGIFANVQRLSLSGKKIKAQAILNDVLLQLEQAPATSKTSVTVDSFRVDEEITVYNNSSSLFQISVEAYDANNEKIAELKKVVYHGN